MPLQPQGGGAGISTPAALTKFVRDAVLRDPPRPVAAQSFGVVQASEAVHTPSVVVGGVTQPKITTQSLSLGPPPNPNDGDIWIARDVDGLGARWQFQYNATSTSAYKWEYIGGSRFALGRSTSDTLTSISVWKADPAVGTITIAREGDYFLGASGWFAASPSGPQTIQITPWYNGAQSGGGLAVVSIGSAGFDDSMYYEERANVGAASTYSLGWWNNSAAAFPIGYREIYVVPIRIK